MNRYRHHRTGPDRKSVRMLGFMHDSLRGVLGTNARRERLLAALDRVAAERAARQGGDEPRGHSADSGVPEGATLVG